MKKTICLFLLLFPVMLTACGNTSVKFNIEDLSKDLIDNVGFHDDMTLIQGKTVETLYNIDFSVDNSVYVSSGATAEEIAVFELKNEEDANRALELARQRIEEQKQAFIDYIPKEVRTLDNAIVKKVGIYIIVCISDSNKADEVINNHIK